MSNWSHIYSIITIETASSYPKGSALGYAFEMLKSMPAISGDEEMAWVVPAKAVVEPALDDKETAKVTLAIFGDLRGATKNGTLKAFSAMVRFLLKKDFFVKVHVLKVN